MRVLVISQSYLSVPGRPLRAIVEILHMAKMSHSKSVIIIMPFVSESPEMFLTNVDP